MLKIKKVSNFSLMRGVWKHHLEIVEFIQNLREQNGELVQFSFGTMNGYFINEPELAQAILVEKWAQYPKSKRYGFLSPLIGRSMLVSNGDEWLERRRLAQPIFKAKTISSYRDLIEAEATSAAGKLKDGEVIDAFGLTSQFTFKVISHIMFSDDVNEIFEEFHHTLQEIQNECTVIAFHPMAFMDKLPLPANIKFRKLSAIIHRIIDGIIEKRMKNPRANEYNDLLAKYLQVIKEENQNFSMVELRNELVTMLIAGNETTALTLAWFLYELARPQNEGIQQELSHEILRQALPVDADETFHTLKQESLLNNAINETLRMYPAVWLFSREALADDVILGVPIKKNSLLIISPYFLGRHPGYWKDPDLWKPERFKEKYNEFTFIPFAKGPRACIGMPLALFEIQLFLFHFIKSMSFSFADPDLTVKPKALVNLYPNTSIKLKVHWRSNASS